MSTSTVKINDPAILHVETIENTLRIFFSDGRVADVPISWYPRLSHALPHHRKV